MHEYKALAELAEKIFNKFRCLFALSGDREFMEAFMQQAAWQRNSLRHHMSRARRIKRDASETGKSLI